jgi:type I restriction enzyme S subunit
MHELFIRGLDRNGQLRPPQHAAPELYKDSQIGWIPKSWKLVPIQQISALIVDCPHSTPVLDDDGYLMARTSEIKDGMLLSAQSPRVSEPEFRKRNLRAKPTPGDIVFTREAPVGENFVIPIGLEICLGQRMMLIRPESTICNSAFLSHYLYTGQVVRRFHRITGGTTNPHLNVADVKMFPVVVPDIEEQHSISDRLAALDEELRTVSKSRLKLQFQKLGALHDLLSEDFPWKLIKETDEPAYV